MPDYPDLPDFEPQTLLYASDLREVVDAVRQLNVDYGDPKSADTRRGPNQRRPRIVEQWIGKVTLKPPSYSGVTDDFTDARYWVVQQACDNEIGDDNQYSSVDDQIPNAVEGSAPVVRRTYVATNTAEITTTATPPTGTHLLLEGDLVHVESVYTRTVPEAIEYVFSRPPVAGVQYVKLTADWSVGENFVTGNPSTDLAGTTIDTGTTLYVAITSTFGPDVATGLTTGTILPYTLGNAGTFGGHITVGILCPVAALTYGAFPVDISQTGGSDGSATAAATWTYDVTMPNGETVTGVSCSRPRPFGTRAAGMKGLAWVTGKLPTTLGLDPFETPGTGTCPSGS